LFRLSRIGALERADLEPARWGPVARMRARGRHRSAGAVLRAAVVVVSDDNHQDERAFDLVVTCVATLEGR
jgi:hypothetical protein